MAKVFIVDRDPAIVSVLGEILEGAGYEVVLCQSGREALQLMQQKKPDLALVDVYVPGLGGKEIVEAMRSSHELSCVPIVLITFSVTAEDMLPPENSYQALLTKPFDINELLAVVNKICPNNIPEQPEAPSSQAQIKRVKDL